VALLAEILFVNLFLQQLKYLRMTTTINWITIFAMILSFALCVAILLFLAFIIYYEDYKQNNNKRSFKLFELIIQKFFEKGVK
jgi:magnesium-transporting ATPase (P-type)